MIRRTSDIGAAPVARTTRLTPLPPPSERRIVEYVRNETFRNSWRQIVDGLRYGSQLVGAHAGTGMFVGVAAGVVAFGSRCAGMEADAFLPHAGMTALTTIGMMGSALVGFSASRMSNASEHVSVFRLNQTVASHTYVVQDAAGTELTRLSAGDGVLERHLDDRILKTRLKSFPRAEWGRPFAEILNTEMLSVFERAAELMGQRDLRALRLWGYLPPRYASWLDDFLVTDTRLSERSSPESSGWRDLAVRAIQLSTEVLRIPQIFTHRTGKRALDALAEFHRDERSGMMLRASDADAEKKFPPFTYPHRTRLILREDMPLVLERLRSVTF